LVLVGQTMRLFQLLIRFLNGLGLAAAFSAAAAAP
jgi:hypothetical protein